MNSNDQVMQQKAMAQRSGKTGLTIWDLFNRPLNSFGDYMPTMRYSREMKTDIKENADGYELTVDLPGCRKEDLNLQMQDGVLTISVQREENTEDKQEGYLLRERTQSSMTRSFAFKDVDENSVEAAFDQGVLTVNLKKAQAAVRKSITIK